MGTNYYYHLRPDLNLETIFLQPQIGNTTKFYPLNVLQLEEPKIHIGKSSAGWCFSLHVYPEIDIYDLEDWFYIFSTNIGQIRNEYDNRVFINELQQTIMCREGRCNWGEPPTAKFDLNYKSWADFHSINHSEKGPKNLLRHKVDGHHCIKQGIGTWDCIIGDFC